MDWRIGFTGRIKRRMLKSGLLVGSLGLFIPGRALAEFQLSTPPSWIEESQAGNPQAVAPCGVAPSACYLTTGAVTTYMGGQLVEVDWTETIPADGWYRIAISYNGRTEIPDPAVSVDDAGLSTDAANTANPDIDAGLGITSTLPVLADGIFPHLASDITAPWNYTYFLEIPNVPCEKCTLQVIQFLGNRSGDPSANPGRYFAHHCADISIVPDDGTAGSASLEGAVNHVGPAGPSAACPPGYDGGTESDGGFGGSPETGAGGTGGDAGGSGASNAGANSLPDAMADSPEGVATGHEGGGCSCAVSNSGRLQVGLGGLLAILAFVRRRRRHADDRR